MSLQAGSGTRTGATGFQESDTSNVLFDETSVTNTSATIQIDDEPSIIRAHHLGRGEAVRVEIVDGAGAGEHVSAYMRNGSQVRLTARCNVTTLAMPGRYRFILDGVVGVAYVRQFRGSMTHEFLLESQAMSCCDDIPDCLPPCGDAGGDLAGTYPNPAVDPVKVADKVSGSNSALVILADALCSKMQSCFTKVFRKCDGSAHEVGDNIPTCQEMLDAIAKAGSGALLDCNGTPITAGTQMATCAQVDSKITAAVGSIPADKFLQDVEYDPATHTITFNVADGGDTFTVNLSDLLPIVTGNGLTGNGTVSTPAAVKPAPNGALSVGSTGVSVKLSSDAGNHVSLGSDGGLFSAAYTKQTRIINAGSNGMPLNNNVFSTLGNVNINRNDFHAQISGTYPVSASPGLQVVTFSLDPGMYDILLSTSFLFLPSSVTTGGAANCCLFLMEVLTSSGVWAGGAPVRDVAQMWQASVSGLAVNEQTLFRNQAIKGNTPYAVVMMPTNAGSSAKLNLLDNVWAVNADGTCSWQTYSTGIATLDFLQ